MINWNRRTYTKEQFTEAWNSSRSMAECAKKLGLNVYGSTSKTMKSTATELGLSSEHMTGQAWNQGLKINPSPPKPIEEYLIDGSSLSSSYLKKRLLREGLLENECSAPYCMIKGMAVVNPFTGEEQKISYHLDHINGKNNDNRIENLRLLCPNCHSMTETYCRGQRTRRGLNPNLVCPDCSGPKGRKSTRCRGCSHKVQFGRTYAPLIVSLCKCGSEKGRYSDRCLNCEHASRKGRPGRPTVNYPPLNDLIQMLKDTNYTQVGKKLGVSDNAVRKYIKNRGIDPKTLTPIKQDATLDSTSPLGEAG